MKGDISVEKFEYKYEAGEQDVGLALETMMCMPTPEIVRHINYEQGRGLPITKN